MAKSSSDVPRPVLKWAGGKRQLLPQLAKYLPTSYGTFIEPFVGGGALFFHLRPGRAVLIDNNPELVNVYRVIKEDVNGLIASLKKHVNDSAYYYGIRNADRDPGAFKGWSDVERASRTIFMNRVCFNGLYRVNKKGEFNVPFGDYKDPVFCDEGNQLAVNQVLQKATIILGSFEQCLDFAKKGDLVYMDPPYVPLSTTASFTSYTRDCFDVTAQKALFSVFQELDDRGCKVMLSNSYCDFILDLYKGYRIETIMAIRAINCVGAKRGKIKEVLVLNRFE
ncbi:MAG: DNA adenine methylase [Candidatus Lokiarchaeota archaeon]|nr:DNA adenine methylase [Candidatus Lokiarchaeota archaeon]